MGIYSLISGSENKSETADEDVGGDDEDVEGDDEDEKDDEESAFLRSALCASNNPWQEVRRCACNQLFNTISCIIV